jgi:hypothetical protein
MDAKSDSSTTAALPLEVALSGLDALERDLDHIRSIASVAGYLIEHELGKQHPASELRALMRVIMETAESAERVRAQALKEARPFVIPPKVASA